MIRSRHRVHHLVAYPLAGFPVREKLLAVQIECIFTAIRPKCEYEYVFHKVISIIAGLAQIHPHHALEEIRFTLDPRVVGILGRDPTRQ